MGVLATIVGSALSRKEGKELPKDSKDQGKGSSNGVQIITIKGNSPKELEEKGTPKEAREVSLGTKPEEEKDTKECATIAER